MEQDESPSVYQLWGPDGVVYGPVDLAGLVTWVKEQRIGAESWVYHGLYDRWQKAGLLPELQILFRDPLPATEDEALVTEMRPAAEAGIELKALRRIRVLGNLSDDQLTRFLGFLDAFPVKQWNMVVKQGDPGDGMYLVVRGEVRVRLMILSRETILTTLAEGEFFGEVSLFDHGPRSADVVANRDSLLLRVSTSSFQRLVQTEPELAAPFLTAICKTLTGRIRADNKRFRDSIKLVRAANQYNNL